MATTTRRAANSASSPAAPTPPGSLALRLINTESMDRGKWHDGLPSPDALAGWWEEARSRCPDECGGTEEPIAWTVETLAAIKALRMTLRALLTRVVEHGVVEEDDLAPLNEFLALGYSALARTSQGTAKLVMRLHDQQQGSVLAPIALSALRLFIESDWSRLHQCQHERCIVFFYDTTKSGTRRWCSPSCMNRARSIQHYRATREAAARE